ncbi:MAG TPA: dTDP-4-dehydrorhamnose 3,5-epimerase [Prolixibacteraceae bacterium]|nr:dTDP-4-dehydrorhamnose 3,5-epimerase [Prolixibacteraceae bacterium]
MKIIETPIPGLLIIEPRVFADERGYFFESYNQNEFVENGLISSFVQDNESKSRRGVIRGLHYQLAPYGQAKLIRVVLGTVYDVAVDLREGSPTFGKWHGLEISAENKKQFYIPKGFAHGFSVLSEEAVFSYKCDAFYTPSADRGIRLDDPALAIDWRIPFDEAVISGKDMTHPCLADAEMNFKFE